MHTLSTQESSSSRTSALATMLLALAGTASVALAQAQPGQPGQPVQPSAPTTLDYVLIGGLVIGGIIALVLILILGQFVSLWIQAWFSNAKIGLLELVFMRIRKVDIKTIVYSRIRAVKSGLDIPTAALETHYLAGGRVPNVVTAMISARGAKIDLPFNVATAIDLAGRDILEAVQTSVNPKVIDCPSPTSPRPTIDAVAKDGIQLKAKARVTVRTNIKQLVGGATEETIVARVGQGIVSTIGSKDNHKHVLENPDEISRKVLDSGLDVGTAFEILSIDIADIDVGENIGAKLQADQANADKQRFQAEAEKRRAMALAAEQENRALIEENKAKLVLAEAEIPRAIAEALRSGNIGAMDFYRLKNIQADTTMRQSIAGDTSGQRPTTG
ncbi:MAG: flotillin-like protein FloA [Planctomycetota bacterium]|nr:flotillin-like protein FloA [Planctomycetota bacterium]